MAEAEAEGDNDRDGRCVKRWGERGITATNILPQLQTTDKTKLG